MKNLKNLQIFAISVLCLPHSNATCERIFSKINSVETKTRNKLITSTVSATVITSECIKRGIENCVNFQPTKEMFDRKTSFNLYPTSQSKTDDTEYQEFLIEDRSINLHNIYFS